MNVLAFESADGGASVAWRDPARIVLKQGDGGPDSLSWFGRCAGEVLGESGHSWGEVQRLAVCRGPGGFTGVRVAVGLVQGLSLGMNCPVAAVSSLQAMAWQGQQRGLRGMLWVALDARMGELYSALYALDGAVPRPVGPERLLRPEQLAEELAPDAELGGPGFEVYAGHWGGRTVQPDLRLDAGAVAELAARMPAEDLVDAAKLQPVYLRNQVAKTLAERAADRGR